VNDEAAQGLLAFFAWSPVVETSLSETFAHLVQEWVATLPNPPAVSAEAFESDVQAFYRGEFEV
jgi:hypothetical protein